MPFLSVIVPIYCVEEYLEECIRSILRQSFRDFELILVDDGSPDGCPKLCDQFAGQDSRVKVIHKENGGLVSARKAGVGISSGRYITFVDSDDWIEPDMYEAMYRLWQKEKPDILATDYYYDTGGDGTPVHGTADAGIYEGERLEALRKQMIYSGKFYVPGIQPCVWNKWFRRELLIPNLMPVDERISMGEDMACTYPAFLDAKRVLISKRCFYHYRFRPSAMSKAFDRNYFYRFRVLYEYLEDCFRKKGRPDMDGQLRYHRVFTSVFGIMQLAGRFSDLPGGKCFRQLRESYGNPDIDVSFEKAVLLEMGIPFLERQVYLAYRGRKTLRLFLLAQAMRVRNRMKK